MRRPQLPTAEALALHGIRLLGPQQPSLPEPGAGSEAGAGAGGVLCGGGMQLFGGPGGRAAPGQPSLESVGPTPQAAQGAQREGKAGGGGVLEADLRLRITVAGLPSQVRYQLHWRASWLVGRFQHLHAAARVYFALHGPLSVR